MRQPHYRGVDEAAQQQTLGSAKLKKIQRVSLNGLRAGFEVASLAGRATMILLFLLPFLFSIYAESACFERYTPQSLRKGELQIHNVLISHYSEYSREQSRMQIQLVKQGEPFVIGSALKCSRPLYSVDSLEKQPLICELTDGKGRIRLSKKAGSPRIIVRLNSGTQFKVIHPKQDKFFQLVDRERGFYVRYDSKRDFADCEELLFRQHNYSLPRLWNEVVLFSIRNDFKLPY